MEADFWHARWQEQRIGFHLDSVNPLLRRHVGVLGCQPGQRILLPLCGKSLDMPWLMAQGLQVVGVELSPLAVDALFASLGLTPEISEIKTATTALRHYRAAQIEIWNGDFFALNPQQLGTIDAVYDRAALVALPAAMRVAYARHLIHLSAAAPQLLISFDYDQSRHAGPPFSVPAAEVAQHYMQHYALQLLESTPLAGGLKGECPAVEQVWHLSPLARPDQHAQ